MQKLYVVEALRFGSREFHSYVVGVYTTFDQAKTAALAEECWRAGKYDCVFEEIMLDSIDNEKLEWMRECEVKVQ